MNKYLLLRDNKESGPYTLAELVEKGIKPYDLVWLEGRSAAWRYPSELDELKRYAPVVEEQPYDRFYKRPASPPDSQEVPRQSVEDEAVRPSLNAVPTRPFADETTRPSVIAAPTRPFADETTRPAVIASQPAAASHQSVQKPAPAEQLLEQYGPQLAERSQSDEITLPDTKEIIAKHPKVFVTLPGGTDRISAKTYKTVARPAKPTEEKSSPNNTRSDVAKSPEKQVDAPPIENSRQNRRTDLPKAMIASTAPSFVPDPASVQADIFGENQANRSHKPATLKKQPATRLAVALLTGVCLLLGGVVIGLYISNSRSKSAELDALVRSIQEREQSKIVPATSKVETSQLAEPRDDKTDPNPSVTEDEPLSLPVAEQKRPESQGTDQTPNENVPVQTNVNAGAGAVEAKNTVIREPLTVPTAARIEALRRDVSKQVSLETNDYKTGVLGGISGLELIVHNNSTFDLDQVVAEIEYLGPEKRVVKRQSIVFNNIRAGQRLTQEVPRTNRGVNINYSIKSIEPGKLKGGITNL